MNKTQNNKAWWLVVPVLILVAFRDELARVFNAIGTLLQSQTVSTPAANF